MIDRKLGRKVLKNILKKEEISIIENIVFKKSRNVDEYKRYLYQVVSDPDLTLFGWLDISCETQQSVEQPSIIFRGSFS